MRLLNVVLYLGQSRLEAAVEDTDGHRRRIDFSWMEKERSDLPPVHWAQAVRGEVEYQQSQDSARESGRYFPF
jgi:hypothetical protein